MSIAVSEEVFVGYVGQTHHPFRSGVGDCQHLGVGGSHVLAALTDRTGPRFAQGEAFQGEVPASNRRSGRGTSLAAVAAYP